MIDRMNSPRRSKLLTGLLFVLPVAVAACGGLGSRTSPGSLTPVGASTSSPSPAAPASPQPTTSLPATPTSTAFHSSISIIDTSLRPLLSYSWHKGCPVPIKDLRYLTMSFWGFDGAVHSGEMVVHENVAAPW